MQIIILVTRDLLATSGSEPIKFFTLITSGAETASAAPVLFVKVFLFS